MRISRRATMLTLVVSLAVASPARAQGPGSGRGFLFRPPDGAIAVRGGLDLASAGSEVFTFVTDELNVDRGDFSAASVVLDVNYGLSPRVSALFSVASSSSKIPSEFRNWLDNNDRPIEQVTTYLRVPITASLKAYLSNPGRSIGRFAWIPKRYAPYVGAGGGVTWYRFAQAGDFIDFKTLKVFGDSFNSEGWAPTVQAFAGTDVSLSARFAVTIEGRYQWAHAALGRDFAGFDRIDLSGFSITSGILIRY